MVAVLRLIGQGTYGLYRIAAASFEGIGAPVSVGLAVTELYQDSPEEVNLSTVQEIIASSILSEAKSIQADVHEIVFQDVWSSEQLSGTIRSRYSSEEAPASYACWKGLSNALLFIHLKGKLGSRDIYIPINISGATRPSRLFYAKKGVLKIPPIAKVTGEFPASMSKLSPVQSDAGNQVFREPRILR